LTFDGTRATFLGPRPKTDLAKTEAAITLSPEEPAWQPMTNAELFRAMAPHIAATALKQ